MKAKLVVEGKEFDIEILDPKLQELIAPKKKTGYERVEHNEKYYTEGAGYRQSYCECGKDIDKEYYKCANYYSDETVAENNTRADNLMRQLRRFSVEHRKKDDPAEKYYIYYLKNANILQLRRDIADRFIGPWFDSQHAGAEAIEKFKDELFWYFTEYKDSL